MKSNSRMAAFQQKSAAFLKRYGFSVVLGLCVLCVAIAATVKLLPQKAAVDPAPTPTAQSVIISSDERIGTITMATPTPLPAIVPTPAPTPSPTPSPTAKPASAPKAPSKASAPIKGEIVWGYAIDTLLYSKTLEQWTTHDGVDIAAKRNSEVKSVWAGTVTRVYEDNALGITVTVAHENGFVSVYANLNENPPVKEGQALNTGDIVGTVGTSARSECALEPHLHFALYQGDASVDPQEHVLLGK